MASDTGAAKVIKLTTDQTWSRIRVEAATEAAQEPILASFLNATILHHDTFAEAMSYRIAQKISDREMNAMLWREVCHHAYTDEPEIIEAAMADTLAAFERDPACHSYMHPFLYFKGFHAVQAQRVANWLWRHDRPALALFLQSRMSELFSIDIHSNAKLGHGLFVDHAHDIVIGETAVVGNNVSMLHGVTLGGTGKEDEDRHPKVEDGVLIGAGAKILGNIRIGKNAKIASGSVVLNPVPSGVTVAGVPAKIVGNCPDANPSKAMDHSIWTI